MKFNEKSRVVWEEHIPVDKSKSKWSHLKVSVIAYGSYEPKVEIQRFIYKCGESVKVALGRLTTTEIDALGPSLREASERCRGHQSSPSKIGNAKEFGGESKINCMFCKCENPECMVYASTREISSA